MSDAAEKIEEIREQKRKELMGEDTNSGGSSDEAPDEPIHVRSPDHFEELINTHDVVLADFHAEWCGPCKMLEPIVEELAAETDAAMAKIDVDDMQGLAQQHRVQGVPTMILFADGEIAERIVGVREKSDIRGLLEREGAA
ncbi:MAG: thioredoxin family protein [Halodesulfurarchaeum sp.]